MIYRTHCALRLGDNLCHLHFMRKLAQAYPDFRFIHYAHRIYLPQLIEVVSDLPNLQLGDLESVSDGIGHFWDMKPHADFCSRNAWKNVFGQWENSPLKNEWVEFSLEHFSWLARSMNLESPIKSADDLLFDYPAIKREGAASPVDMLIVNSAPMSGQLPGYNPAEMEELVGELSQRYSCITTQPTKYAVSCTQHSCKTVSQIGWLSTFCKYIVMISTGPSWPTFNIFNKDTVQFRLILIGQEEINLTKNTEHAGSVFEARRRLQERGLL